jgi:hypothetical protein
MAAPLKRCLYVPQDWQLPIRPSLTGRGGKQELLASCSTDDGLKGFDPEILTNILNILRSLVWPKDSIDNVQQYLRIICQAAQVWPTARGQSIPFEFKVASFAGI